MLGVAGKIRPPTIPATYVERPRLIERLDQAWAVRLTTIIGGPGFGKSTLVARWASRQPAIWYRLDASDNDPIHLVMGFTVAAEPLLGSPPAELDALLKSAAGPDLDDMELAESLAARVAEWIEPRGGADLALVLDDVHQLDAQGPASRLVHALCRHAPSRLHVVLASQADPPFPVARLRTEGMVEIGADQLAMTPDEIGALLSVIGVSISPLADQIHELTSGWPVAVRLVAEALKDVPAGSLADVVGRLSHPGGALYAYLVEEVLERAPVPVRNLIRTVAPLDAFSPELCEHLGVTGARELVDALDRRGLFVERRAETDMYGLADPLREVARAILPLGADELATVQASAARWFVDHGFVADALALFLAAGDVESAARLLEHDGDGLVSSGNAAAVIAAAEALPEPVRGRRLDLIEGRAREVRGDWEGALACFERAGGDGEWDAGLAWRVGVGLYLRGRTVEALDAFGRARREPAEPSDLAVLDAWAATAHRRLGDTDTARALVRNSLVTGRASGDDHALATAHTVAAMMASTDGDVEATEEHSALAVAAAERSGDILQIVRIRSNRGSHRNEQGRHEEALVDLEIALGLASLAGYAAFHTLALSNRGDAYLGLGRIEQALADYEASRRMAERFGLRKSCYPWTGIGDVHRLRGELTLARSAYEHAAEIARQASDLQGLVPALAGLARVTAADDLAEANRVAKEATAEDGRVGSVAGRLAAGWVALAEGEEESAARLAQEVLAEARHRHQLASLAEALELASLASGTPEERLERLAEAATIWRAIGNTVGAATNELVTARVSGARQAAVTAERRLADFGIRAGAALAAGPRHGAARVAAPIAVQALGGFVVLREGRPIPLADWRSKKSRDLLKLLVARRGRPIPRDVAAEALWPEEERADLGPRLSVALSTMRRVLDPERRYAADHFVRTPEEAIALNLPHVEVDSLTFIGAAEQALTRVQRDGLARAAPALLDAEQLYIGEFLAEDVYEDWTIGPREECRAAYVALARELARHATGSGDHDGTVRFCLRLLEHDSYDEEAHLLLARSLVASGRHGEARRQYQRYAQRMAEIDVEPAPFPHLGR
ncbi:MAG: BTAD domain-containing putative transcriptional regulator [Acidimicrobiales bacterium]